MALKYKVGDRVRIKSIDWYNKNKDTDGKVWTSGGQIPFDKCMSEWCGKVMTISHVRTDHYTMVEDLVGYWSDEMIESKVEDTITTNELLFVPSNISLEKEMEWNLPEGYIFKDENGNVINATKIVLEKKKKEYPKTYEECAEVLDVCSGETLQYGDLTLSNDYEFNLYTLLENFRKLLICRDAYWKIAGEEMGLDGPWEPDWKNDEQFKYIITCRRGCIIKDTYTAKDVILAFPTAEMRDAFRENFDQDIEFCKELL